MLARGHQGCCFLFGEFLDYFLNIMVCRRLLRYSTALFILAYLGVGCRSMSQMALRVSLFSLGLVIINYFKHLLDYLVIFCGLCVNIGGSNGSISFFALFLVQRAALY